MFVDCLESHCQETGRNVGLLCLHCHVCFIPFSFPARLVTEKVSAHVSFSVGPVRAERLVLGIF